MKEHAIIEVIIADDHAIVREGLKQILSDTKDIVVKGEADCGLTAVKMCREHPYHVLLLDIALPDKSGIEILKQIKKELPDIAVVMLSMHPEDQYAIRSLKAGASGYLNKQSAPKELVSAIRQVALGLKYINASVAQELANHIDEEHRLSLHETLSDREYQTMTLIASGKAVSDIARELSLSVKTISEYRSRVLLKMRLKNNAELTHYAIKNQLIE